MTTSLPRPSSRGEMRVATPVQNKRPKTATPLPGPVGDEADMAPEVEDFLAPPRDLSPPRAKTPRLKNHALPFFFTPAAKESMSRVIRPKSALSADPLNFRSGSVEPRPASALASFGPGVLSASPKSVRSGATPNTPGPQAWAQSASGTPSFVDSPPRRSTTTVRKKAVMDPELAKELRARERNRRLTLERERLERLVNALHEQYDESVRVRNQTRKKLRDAEDRSADMDLEERGLHAATVQSREKHILVMEAKLQYWLQALLQEVNYSKSLQHMGRRLNDAKNEDRVRIQERKAECDQYSHDLSALLNVFQQVKAEQTMVEQQIAEYRYQLSNYRKEFKKRIRERKMQHHNNLAQLHRGAEGHFERSPTTGWISKRIPTSSAKDILKSISSDFRQGNLEDGFREIQNITGESDISKVIESFVYRDVKREHFQELLKEAKAKVERMVDEKARLDVRLNTMKFHGFDVEGDRRAAEDLNSKNRDVQKVVEDRLSRVKNMDRVIVAAKAGLDYLIRKLQCVVDVEGDTAALQPSVFSGTDESAAEAVPLWVKTLGSADIADPQYSDVLKTMVFCGDKLEKVWGTMKQQELSSDLQDAVIGKGLGLETMAVNQRVELPKHDYYSKWDGPLVTVEPDGHILFEPAPVSSSSSDDDDEPLVLSKDEEIPVREDLKLRSDKLLRQRRMASKTGGRRRKKKGHADREPLLSDKDAAIGS